MEGRALRSARRTMLRARVALATVIVVVALVAAKLIVHAFGWEFIVLSPLYTSIVAGGIFVIGLIVAGTLSDYKESERMPAEITGALQNIYEDCRVLHERYSAFDLWRVRLSLIRIVSSLREDLQTDTDRGSLTAINDLSGSITELEELGTPPPYIVRLRNEQGAVRKTVLRMYHIQRTEFLPSAYFLIQTMVALTLLAFEFTVIEPLSLALVILVFISYFFVYLVKLLKILDSPFRDTQGTGDAVSLLVLNEFAHELSGP